MNIFKNKLLWIAPIAIIVLLIILATAFYPAYNPSPKSLPIAIVNHDKGNNMQGQKVNVGKNLEDKLTDSDSDKIKWVSVDSEKEARKGLKEQKYFGVAVIEQDFSKNALSKTQKLVSDSKQAEIKEKAASGEIPPAQLQQMKKQMANKSGSTTDVKQANIKTIVNGGASMQAVQIANNVLSKVGENVNSQISQQSLEILNKQDVKVSAKDIKDVMNPVSIDKETINKVKSHQANGNGPFLMFMPVWMSALVSSVLLFYAFRTSNNIKLSQRLIASLAQMTVAVVTAFIGGFGYIYFMSEVQNFNFDDINKIAIYVSIAIIAFIGLILGTMSWLGMKAIPIFFLLMFFSMQLVTLPKQFLPQFYQDYIVSWNPFTHYANYLRELLYMNQSLEMNSTMWMFIGFMIFGIVSILTATMIRKHSDKRTEVPS
ncbi:YhgE/Pip domain-containing protein [Staphylococcus gallinarum]|uniref:YhgE/Pip domain-containing protein n=1 Tax=Staphylococcus gallinarum TaxID=1293 RepID=UPI001E3C6DFE|nr:ABC transporter permease [Staphylococcus gallinarum]MCD8920393.1 ABC transporter permease [Staphylococcus gallinarum]MEB6278484.1 ABC transporter permease [Staphylococcus gallinarum]UEG99834.1 ABC transporter permease [Staphylococcus gallinarum]